ncbi:ABC transporter ATP-binding protein [Arcobacter roscoffensis]|uniref:ATP-binding cassette domain-containing protein n=1 Tax=Arcobacter roscoffensis TaxID=2961520 RepID=A0ABY5E8J3_9BACT|nr:ATP-binding cassette domain-containing protein [Arcobacter roscoffensis]UTJ07854.1 ATP-binding cassette domain-containing protein [Arcobacter roscoffensis]
MIKIDIQKSLHGQIGDINLDVNLQIQKGDFIALTGKSGSGKTTLLRILAGLESANGNIEVNSVTWLDDKTNLAVQKRDIGFVFQDYALFENMSVLQNLLYVKKDKDLAFKLLELCDLKNLINRYPNSLSGGQKQRLSICRAMMNKPKLLLLDEPLSALDPKMRNSLQDEILSLHKEFNTTTIMVSHEPREIYKLSNRVILLENGEVLNDGKPKDVLLKTQGSQKFSFEGEILDIIKIDVVNIAIISIGQQLVEVVLSNQELQGLKIGSKINVGTKAFAPVVK